MKLKKCITMLISIILFSAPIVSAAENWEQIAENFYFDTNSTDKQYGDYITGYFKQTNVNETIKRRQVAYTKIWIGAYCDIDNQNGIKKLEYPIYWYYDKKNKLIKEDNIHKDWKKQFPGGHLGIMHAEDDDFGELYFNTLCKYK